MIWRSPNEPADHQAVSQFLYLSAAVPAARYVEYLTPAPYLDAIIIVPLRPDAGDA